MSDVRISAHAGSGNRAQRRAQAARDRARQHALIEEISDIDSAFAEATEKHSAAIDIVSEEDRKWFADKPDRTLRLRDSAAVEITFHEIAGLTEASGACAYTLVIQVEPGGRIRIPFRTHTTYRTEHYGENACAALLAELREDRPEIALQMHQTRQIMRKVRRA